jgi:pimeloyl-ACP methyl ester carboxylesterase
MLRFGRLSLTDRCLTQSLEAVRAEVLLLGGSESPSFLKRTLDALCRVLPNVERVELQGLSHGAALDGGKPERVAQELRSFFLQPQIYSQN